MTLALAIEPDGGCAVHELVEDTELRQLQALVDGYIEGIYGPGWVGFVNEEGLIKNLDQNVVGTNLAMECDWYGGLPLGEFLRGTIVFLGEPNEEGESTDVSPDMLRMVGIHPEQFPQYNL